MFLGHQRPVTNRLESGLRTNRSNSSPGVFQTPADRSRKPTAASEPSSEKVTARTSCTPPAGSVSGSCNIERRRPSGKENTPAVPSFRPSRARSPLLFSAAASIKTRNGPAHGPRSSRPSRGLAGRISPARLPDVRSQIWATPTSRTVSNVEPSPEKQAISML